MAAKDAKGRIDAMFASSMQKSAGASAAVFRLAEDAGRVEDMLLRAVPPEDVGPAPVAPARGTMRLELVRETVNGLTKRVLGRRMEQADVFDVMIAQARRRHGDSDAPFVAPFQPGQVYMARHYRDLTERYEAGGVRCSSLEAGREGGEGGGFMDAYLADGRLLAKLHRLIGTGEAMAVRRIRPSKRGSKAGITDRRLVDMVCLGGLTFDQVLERHGWVPKGEHRHALRTALCGALDRMQGYR
jgi:hypothetical protein